jgi:hypothetical protein
MNRAPGSAIGIVAGRGSLPRLLAGRLVGAGERVVVAALSGQADTRRFERCFAVRTVPVGAIGAAARFLLENGAPRAVFAGGVERSLLPGRLRLDRHALALLPAALLRGDDGLLRLAAGRFERLGVAVGDPAEHLGDLLAGEGLIAGPEPGPATLRDLAVARREALAAGSRDRGQAALAFRGRPAGREGRGGTDALLAAAPGPGAVLVKVCKPGQDLRFDRPAIGPATVLAGRLVGLSAIGVEAGGCFVLEPDRVRALCDAHGISLVGLHPVGRGKVAPVGKIGDSGVEARPVRGDGEARGRR